MKKVYVYRTDWECFWHPERHIISPYASIWSVEHYNEDCLFKLVLSLNPISIELAKSSYCRPILKLLGEYDLKKYKKPEDSIVTSFKILEDDINPSTMISFHKMRTAKKETVSNAILYIPDTEESDIIMDVFGKLNGYKYDILLENIKELEEAL